MKIDILHAARSSSPDLEITDAKALIITTSSLLFGSGMKSSGTAVQKSAFKLLD